MVQKINLGSLKVRDQFFWLRVIYDLNLALNQMKQGVK